MNLLNKVVIRVKNKVKPNAKVKIQKLPFEDIDNLTFPLDLFETKQSYIDEQYENAKVFSERIKTEIEGVFNSLQMDVNLIDTHIAGINLVYKYNIKKYIYPLDTKTIEKIEFDISERVGLPLFSSVSVSYKQGMMTLRISLKQYDEYNYCVPIDNRLLFGSKKIDNASEMIMGLTIENELFEYNIDNYRNMLVVGQAGCGKTTWFDQILISMMSRNSPSDIKIGLIDFSGCQYAGYDGLPYMVTDVVSDIDKAKVLLERINKEVEYRHQTFVESNVENIKKYNDMADKSGKTKFARWTIVVEEIQYVKQHNEAIFELLVGLLSKIHSLSNVGIHFIVSLQHSDLITEKLIASCDLKSCLKVHNGIESQRILGTKGAVRLDSQGDILVQGDEKLVRLQSSYISDIEKLAIFDYLKNNYDTPKYKSDRLMEV